MKRIITLVLVVLTAFGFQSKAQTTPPCNADFNFTISNFTVQFTPVMVGEAANTSHYWSFGDGSTVSAVSPAHTYVSVGSYSVKHYIIKHNPNGVEVCRDSVTKTVLIQQTTACNLQAYFTWSAVAASWNTIHFQNQSLPSEAADSIRWTFGDGTPAVSGLVGNLSAPTHIYPNAGTYNVCIRVKKNNAPGTTPCVSEFCKIVVVAEPCTLVASFTSVPDPNHALRIKFTNTSTPAAPTDSVRWTFGDGTSVTGLQSDPNVANPTHNYTQSGVYNVCIRVKKNSSIPGIALCVKELCKITIVQSPCNTQVNFSMHRDSLSPRKVYFTNLTIVTTTNAIAKWSFGDGTYSGTWNTAHEYAQPGTYRVCLTIQTEPNCIREKCDTIIIPVPAPSCKELSVFKFEKFSNDNQKYKFIPEHILNDVQYTWTFGDGTGSHDPIATHRYAQPGIYIACLTAWRGPNCASTTCKEIRVLPQINCDSIHVGYNYQRDPVVPNKIYFYANANYPILDQTWTITRLAPATTPPVILHQNNPVYVFHDTGYYRVCLKAITLGGCVKEYCNVIRIERVVNTVCELQAFPNPATTVVNVNVVLALSGTIDAYVYNSMNVLVKEKHQAGIAGTNIVSININDLTAGLYTIKVIYGGKTCYARFNKL